MPEPTVTQGVAAYRARPVRDGFAVFRLANVQRFGEAFHGAHEWPEPDWATAAAGELREASNLLTKRRCGGAIPIVLVARELADAVTHIDLLAASMGIDLGAAMIEKFNLVSERVGSRVRFTE